MNTQIPTILHVEDESNDHLLVKIAFRKAELQVNLQIAEDGDEAIAYLNGNGVYSDRSSYPLPNLILLDLRLPRKSGLEFLNWMQSQPALKTLPVVTLSSSEQPDDRDKACAQGAHDYFCKPVAIGPLQQVVREIYFKWLA
jgi:CheY-like chemotaxis protein